MGRLLATIAVSALNEAPESAITNDSDKIFLLAPFPQLARAVSSRGALKGELLVREGENDCWMRLGFTECRTEIKKRSAPRETGTGNWLKPPSIFFDQGAWHVSPQKTG